MDQINSQIFDVDGRFLAYEADKSILICKDAAHGNNLWVKKLRDITGIYEIIDDDANYYIAAECDEITGQYFAVRKIDGSTLWDIPGRAFFHLVFGPHLYLIFIDDTENYYLIKVEAADGTKLWHYKVNCDLSKYSFSKDRIKLIYESGLVEIISPSNGSLISRL